MSYGFTGSIRLARWVIFPSLPRHKPYRTRQPVVRSPCPTHVWRGGDRGDQWIDEALNFLTSSLIIVQGYTARTQTGEDPVSI